MPRRGTPEHAAVYKIMGREPPGAKKGEAPAAPPAAPMSHKMEAPVVAMTASERGMKASEAREAARPAAPKEEAPAPKKEEAAPAPAPAATKEKAIALKNAKFGLGHIAWRRFGGEEFGGSKYTTKDGVTMFEVILPDYTLKAYPEISTLNGQTIEYAGGSVRVSKSGKLVVKAPSRNKDAADKWFEQSFGSGLMQSNSKRDDEV